MPMLRQLKDSIKGEMLKRLHARPAITEALASKVVRDGVPRYLQWSYTAEKERVLRYVESQRTAEFDYRFCDSAPGPCLYGSIYACMLLGMFGELEKWDSQRKAAWVAYFDRFQSETDGLFRDPSLNGPDYEGEAGWMQGWGDGWGARHLAGHIIIAYARLGATPRYPFRFLEPFFEKAYLDTWLKQIDFSSAMWGQSNYIMNLFILLQYARDYQGETRAADPIKQILEWLQRRQRADTGMWHDYTLEGYPAIGDAIRAAYHFYPLYVYEGVDIPHKERIIDTILDSQNSWGGFNPEGQPSGACEDIDALEPLIRMARACSHRKEEVRIAVQRAFVWIMACQGADGGYASLPMNACHYGAHPFTTSEVGESNLFATWFRSLCLCYVVDFLEVRNEYSLGRYPGYEIALD